MDYRRENGRTYHKLSDGKYVLPNDEVFLRVTASSAAEELLTVIN